MSRDQKYDVAILGSGMAGAMLGAILARGGADVLILDERTHPRHTPGESTTPRSLIALRLLADRYGVPEIKTLTTFRNCSQIIGSGFGIKRHFGFVMHHEGKSADPREARQVTNGPLSAAPHLYRQDSDAYLFYAAVGYGVTAQQGFRISGIDITGSEVAIDGADGSHYTASYLVDTTGEDSPLASALALRETPTRLRHKSRGLRTHMLGVRTADEVFSAWADSDKPPVPWHEGTLQHLFEGGWFSVVPLGNHKDSRNPATAVMLNLDSRRYPAVAGLSAADEFAAHVSRFPDVARQFDGAVPLRPWESVPSYQYSSTATVGDRWCLLGSAAGFVDPLFSRDLSDTAESINALAWRLLRAVKDDDFSASRFAFVDQFQRSLLDFDDSLAAAAYAAFGNDRLWNAVFRIWGWGSGAGTFRMQQALTRYLGDHDESHLNALEKVPHPGYLWPDHDGYFKLFTQMALRCEEYRQGQVSGERAASELFASISGGELFPRHVGFAEQGERFINPTPRQIAAAIRAASNDSDPAVRRLLTGNVRALATSKLRGYGVF